MSTSATTSSVAGRTAIETTAITLASVPAAPSTVAEPSARPAMSNAPTPAHPIPAPTDAAIETLLRELEAINITAQRRDPLSRSTSSTADPVDTRTDKNEEASLGQLINELFDSHLAHARKVQNPQSRLQSLQLAVSMLSQIDTAKRVEGRLKLAATVADVVEGKPAERLYALLLNDLIAANVAASHEVATAAAEEFARVLCAATSDIPYVAKCKLLTLQLQAAVRLDAPAMAELCTAAFTQHVVDDDAEVACRRIEMAATYLGLMPAEFVPMTAMALYQCVPTQRPWQLPALEAIAAKDIMLPQSNEARAVFKIIHQKIYELRLAALNT